MNNPITFQHYRNLPAAMFNQCLPTPVEAPELIELNQNLLAQYNVDPTWFKSKLGLLQMAGNFVDETNSPIAMAYSGHQFGNWVPLLGDGRAHMLGQMSITQDQTVDIQLKGSGRTKFSRGGDGRATLGAVLREYLISEAMAGLGIATSRSIAVIKTGESVLREHLLPGAILVRSATSHIRVGSFQFAASNMDIGSIRALADFMIDRHFSQISQSSSKYLDFLNLVIRTQALLIAQWMLVGFIHGVMNTDNMSIVGETIDYGPCAFIDTFKPNQVFSSIDRYGRYAWDQQSAIGLWNLTRFAESLLPLLHENRARGIEIAEEQLSQFIPYFQKSFEEGFCKKLGLMRTTENCQFVPETLSVLSKDQIDFTLFFDELTQLAADGQSDKDLLKVFDNKVAGRAWVKQWKRLRQGNSIGQSVMRTANPIVIARNHQVEKAIEAAQDHGDFTLFRRLSRILTNPFELARRNCEFRTPPKKEERVTQTFCGT